MPSSPIVSGQTDYRLEHMQGESDKDIDMTDGNGSSDFLELRRLLLSQERELLSDARVRIEDLEQRKRDITSDDVSELLPEAIVSRARKDNKLANALGPTVEKTLHGAVRRDPQPIVDAIFPVIGPAIRKSIAEALSSTLESINQTMENRFSWQSIKWRLEARRSGRTLSEVALSHTLLYKIDQIFIIDHETSVPLLHVSSESAQVKDSSMVSGMVSVIQDFVRDSFGSDEDETLETLEVGDVNIWFESGPEATLAAVILGTPPRTLRDHLKELIEYFHLTHGEEMQSFQGDVSPFQVSMPVLRAGLLEQHDEQEKKRSLGLWLILGVLALLVGWLIYSAIENNNKREHLIDMLNEEPGVIVTDYSTRSGMLYVKGLQDPMVANFNEIVAEAGLDPNQVVFDWEQYHTLAPEILTERARGLLDPPEGVTISARDAVVYVTGTASDAWAMSARNKSGALTSAVQYDDTALVIAEDLAIGEAIEQISGMWIPFAFGSAVISPEASQEIDDLLGQINILTEAAAVRGRAFRIILTGGASGDPSAARNRLLMRVRSEAVRAELISRGADPGLFVTETKVEGGNAIEESPDNPRARSVELSVVSVEAP